MRDLGGPMVWGILAALAMCVFMALAPQVPL